MVARCDHARRTRDGLCGVPASGEVRHKAESESANQATSVAAHVLGPQSLLRLSPCGHRSEDQSALGEGR